MRYLRDCFCDIETEENVHFTLTAMSFKAGMLWDPGREPS